MCNQQGEIVMTVVADDKNVASKNEEQKKSSMLAKKNFEKITPFCCLLIVRCWSLIPKTLPCVIASNSDVSSIKLKKHKYFKTEKTSQNHIN